MSKVSVVISTYNRPELLKRAIRSVINQTYQDWECIVVVDGPDLPQLPDEAQDKPIYRFSIDHFGNDTKPKNTGILKSKGQYIAFLDDDNTWRPDHLQVLVNELERNPRTTLAYSDRWINDPTAKIPGMIGAHSNFDMNLLLHRNYIDTSDVLIRREALFAVGGWDERYRKYVDWNLWVRLAKAGYTFTRVPVITTDYYIHPDMKSVKVQTEGDKATGTFTPDWDPYSLEIELPYLGEIPEPRVAIFSLTYDRLDYTKKCFESLYKTAGYPFYHVIVDNGSADGTPDYLAKTYPEAHIISNPENVGISKGSNQALDWVHTFGTSDFDIIVKVDNDCLFITPDWLKTMVKIWKANHRLALSCYVQGLKDNPGGAPRIGEGWVAGEYVGVTKHLGGICHFVDADAYKDWRWSEDDFLHGVQDLEFSQYLTLRGYQMGYLENYFCEHIEGTEKQHQTYPEYFQRRVKEKQTKYEKD